MAKWDYDLGSYGLKLRELITEGDSSKENCENVLKQIIVCCEYLLKNLTDEDDDWYKMDLDDLIQDCEDTQYYLDEDDEEVNEDNINDVLETFYDLMDSMRVWVAL